MTKIRLRDIVVLILFALFIIITSHLDFMDEVRHGRAIDSKGNIITMQDATWFCDSF